MEQYDSQCEERQTQRRRMVMVGRVEHSTYQVRQHVIEMTRRNDEMEDEDEDEHEMEQR